MYVENANRPTGSGLITLDNLEPNPKNPVIAAFFRNIGYADQLGSGVRNLFKYTKYYSGQDPQFVEGDVFRIIVPLDDSYSFDFGSKGQRIRTHIGGNGGIIPESSNEQMILRLVSENPQITQKNIQSQTGLPLRTIQRTMAELQKNGILRRKGSTRSGEWIILNK